MPVLSSAVGIFEIFMSQWEALGEEYPKLTPWIKVGLLWAKKYYNLMDDIDAYIVTIDEFLFLSHHELMTDHHNQSLTLAFVFGGLQSNGAEPSLRLLEPLF
jgi:hypothetical protein